MTESEALKYINSLTPDECGFERAKQKNSWICPICGNGSNEDGTGFTKDKSGRYGCFVCGFTSASMVDLLAMAEDVTDTSPENFHEVIRAAASKIGITLDSGTNKDFFISKAKKQAQPATNTLSMQEQTTPTPKENEPISEEYKKHCRENLSKSDYLTKERGISAATVAKFDIGYDEHFANFGGNGAIIFFTGEASLEARNTKEKNKIRHNHTGNQQIFNREALKGNVPVFVVESPIDVLSIIEAGGQAVSAGGAKTWEEPIFAAVKNGEVTCPRLLVAFDNDDAGKKARDKATKGLQALKYPFDVVDIYGDVKDANDALRKDRKKFGESVKKAMEKAKTDAKSDDVAQVAESEKNYVGYLTQDFLTEIERFKVCYPTGFSKLDKILYGGLRSGLYILGAVSGLGKTAFCLQIADYIAQSGREVMFFSLEMSKWEMMTREISLSSYRLSWGNKQYKPYSTEEIFAGEFKRDDLNEAMKRCSKYKLQIIEGDFGLSVKQIGDDVTEHLRLGKEPPVVIIDYLQTLKPCDDRKYLSDKQVVDENVVALKRLSRDRNIPILAISSLNRANYKSMEISSFKESGSIEYSGDVVMGLEYKGHGKTIAISLKVMKNRNGKKGDVDFTFTPQYNYFAEAANTHHDDDDDDVIEAWQ